MKQNQYVLNTALAAVLGLSLTAAVLLRTWVPRMVLPGLDIPAMVLLSLAALLLDHYLTGGARRCWICIPLLGGVSFGLLPWAACFTDLLTAGKLALLGAVVFTVVTWLFTSIQDRLSSGPAAKAAPVISALCLFLASQCFMGMGV